MEGRISELEMLHRLTADYYSKISAEYGLKFFHIRYILEICESPGRQQDSFVRQLNKSSIARHMAFLEENGFIERKARESDRRALKIYPTEKSEKIYPRLRAALEKWETALTGDISAEEDRMLERVLLKLKQNAESFLNGGEE